MADIIPVTPDDRKWAFEMMMATGRVAERYLDAIMAGEWDAVEEVQIVARHRVACTQFEGLIYDAHFPSMSARFRIPEGVPFAGGIYGFARIRTATEEDYARWAHLPQPPAEGYED